MAPHEPPQIFRPYRALAVTMGLAGVLWAAVLFYLTTFDGVPAKTYASAAFFVGLFAVAVAYYGRSAIVVDEDGITVRGILRTRRIPFAEIRKVDVLPGPLTVYAIRGRQRFVHFTSFFARHKRLMALLLERSGASPQRV